MSLAQSLTFQPDGGAHVQISESRRKQAKPGEGHMVVEATDAIIRARLRRHARKPVVKSADQVAQRGASKLVAA
jgi:hypothetical protein